MASKQEIFALIRNVLTEMELAGPGEAVSLQTPIAELGFDSLSTLEFLMLIDEQTGAEVEVEDLTPEATLAELVDIICQKSV